MPPGQHDGISRSKSWSQKTHDKDQADSGGLPEWCNDDSFDDNTPGCFDASGQFCSFKVSSLLPDCINSFHEIWVIGSYEIYWLQSSCKGKAKMRCLMFLKLLRDIF